MDPVGCIYNPDNVERVKYAYSQGHQVASHGWSHQYLTNLGASQSTYDLKILKAYPFKLIFVMLIVRTEMALVDRVSNILF